MGERKFLGSAKITQRKISVVEGVWSHLECKNGEYVLFYALDDGTVVMKKA